MIKKFKNGKIKLEMPKTKIDKDLYLNEDGSLRDEYYYNEVEIADLYFNQINGYMYIVDFNTQLVYELESQNIQNPLKWLLESIQEYGRYYLYPLSKGECKQLMIDLEDEY